MSAYLHFYTVFRLPMSVLYPID